MTDTARIIILQKGKLLLLQKSAESKNPNMWEFPGGKVEKGESLIEAAVKEVEEETTIRLVESQLEKLDYELSYSFEHNGQKLERNVFYFKVNIGDEIEVQINNKLNEDGQPEDKHADFKWMSLDEYRELVENNTVSQNSIITSDSIY